MNRNIKAQGVLAVLLVSIVVVIGSVAVAAVEYSNREVRLRNRYEAGLEKVQAVHDNIARIVNGKAGVTTEYKKAILDAINIQIQGRKGGDIAKAISEAAPGLDVGMYRDVANGIEAQRTGFVNAQTELLAVVQEHKNLIQGFPSSLVVGSRKPLEYKTIKSTNTEKVFSTGKDDSEHNPFAR